jgi:RHH-type proline utilization regulon transcriptional repressor/proline dehydrogenase/delta 1-pyrroline-5-carboxylate dehydrogenase
VIDAEARRGIERTSRAMRAKAARDRAAPLPMPGAAARHLRRADADRDRRASPNSTREVFGPVLHVCASGARLDAVVDAINATGYGLTLGIHSASTRRSTRIAARARVGNQYVNRNMIGAVVGVQPFGGEGLSGTGPKAGGPLRRLLHGLSESGGAVATDTTAVDEAARARALAPLRALRGVLAQRAAADPLVALCDRLAAASPLGRVTTLPGPTGERNTYALLPRRTIVTIAQERGDLLLQFAYVLAAGARACWPDDDLAKRTLAELPPALRERVELAREPLAGDVDAVLVLADAARVREWSVRLAQRPGPIVTLQAGEPGARHAGVYVLERLLVERTVSVNTAAAGGNANLMTIG